VFSFPKTANPIAKSTPPTAPTIEQEGALPEASAEDDGDDELVLDSDDILTQPVGKPPIAPPTDEETAAPAPPPPATTGGGTLFERMSNIARGAPKAQLDADEEKGQGGQEAPIDIPRFLNRQSNQ
jgi:cell division protein FtsZ